MQELHSLFAFLILFLFQRVHFFLSLAQRLGGPLFFGQKHRLQRRNDARQREKENHNDDNNNNNKKPRARDGGDTHLAPGQFFGFFLGQKLFQRQRFFFLVLRDRRRAGRPAGFVLVHCSARANHDHSSTAKTLLADTPTETARGVVYLSKFEQRVIFLSVVIAERTTTAPRPTVPR